VRLSDIDWRWALPRILLVFVATRLLVVGVAFTVETLQPPPPELLGDQRPIISSLTVSDTTSYLSIATSGYHAEFERFPNYAFYPGYPVVIRALTPLIGGDAAVAAIVASNLAFLLALVALYALSVRYLEPGKAILSLWFLALAPGAIGYSLAYSESLFLLFTVCAFLAMETRHGWLAGIALALATFTRVPGILLGLPLLLLIVERDGWRPSRAWLPLLLAPLVLAGFFAYLWWLTGDPLATVSAQSEWKLFDVGSTTAPNPVTEGADGAVVGVQAAPDWVIALWVAVLAFYTFLFVYFRPDRIRPAYWLVAMISVATVFFTGKLVSSPRYLSVAWPFDWVLANRKSTIGRGSVLIVFLVLHVFLLWQAFTFNVPP
jgi:Gpi18-like mannosyltransferase